MPCMVRCTIPNYLAVQITVLCVGISWPLHMHPTNLPSRLITGSRKIQWAVPSTRPHEGAFLPGDFYSLAISYP